MEEYAPIIIETSEDIEDTTQMLNANDYYNSSDICECMLPIRESAPLNYSVVDNTSDKYIEVNYCLW